MKLYKFSNSELYEYWHRYVVDLWLMQGPEDLTQYFIPVKSHYVSFLSLSHLNFLFSISHGAL
jgi:hypothetical protein